MSNEVALATSGLSPEIIKQAEFFANSTLIPKAFKGNVANIYIGIKMADDLNVDPLVLMQNTDPIMDRLVPNSKFKVALYNRKYNTIIRYKMVGTRGAEDWGYYCYTLDKEGKEDLVGQTITLKLARDAKWIDRNGSQWRSDPENMLMRRAAARFVDAYAPEIGMALPDLEDTSEFIESIKVEKEINPQADQADQFAEALKSLKSIEDRDSAIAYCKQISEHLSEKEKRELRQAFASMQFNKAEQSEAESNTETDAMPKVENVVDAEYVEKSLI